jgi:exopolyphosphatase/pppGpp-phosphohydrolase
MLSRGSCGSATASPRQASYPTRRWTAPSRRFRVCADKLRRRNVSLSRSVATEACRRAANGRKFVDRVRNETGIALEIIEPAGEARLAMLGCHKLLEPGDGPALIFDIGGGSTELVLIDQVSSGIPGSAAGGARRGASSR